jgi:valyl-tRNA synthetase
MKVGRKLAVKLLNASKFALSDLPAPAPAIAAPLDRAMLARLARLARESAESFEAYDYARALQHTEELFWWYCDYYLELVKGRRYSPDPEIASAVARSLRISLSCFQRLFAPFLPFVCEEVWSWWQEGSIHRAAWPEAAELAEEAGGERREDEELALEVAADVLREVRKAKSDAKRPMRAPVSRVVVRDTAPRLAALELGASDLREAGSIAALETVEAGEASVAVELAEDG